MSAKGINDWLSAVMLDEEMMAQARHDIAATFKDYDLTAEERAFLTDPAASARPAALSSHAAMVITAVRPHIIRTPHLVTPRPVRPTTIARLPEALQLLYPRASALLPTAETDRMDVAQKATLAEQMVDALFAQTEVHTLPQPTPRRLLERADITIVGLGMRSLDQLTREVERALAGAKQVFLIDGSPGLQQRLQRQGTKVIDLCSFYAEGKDRLHTYREMAKAVVAGAIHDGPVAFGLYGHPTIFAFPPFVVKEVAESLGLTVDVLPGVSAMDCLFAELMIDPANGGLQMFEATELLLTQRELPVDVQTLVWQVGTLESGLYSTKPSAPERFARFLAYLRRFFPGHHPCTAIYCSDHPAIPSTILRFPLDQIGDFSGQLHGGFTLYLPPARIPEVLDKNLEKALSSNAHLEQVTRR